MRNESINNQGVKIKSQTFVVKTDEFISYMNNDDILTYENAEISRYFECNTVSFVRKSADTSINVYGYQMLDVCKSNYLFILNGRFGEDKISPKLTCKDASTVDYFISSPQIFAHTADFQVHDFSTLYSDSHCPIALHLGNCSGTTPGTEIRDCANSKIKLNLWNKEKKEIFTENLNRSYIADIDAKLNFLNCAEDVTVSDINSVINDINDHFLKTCEITFGYTRNTPKNVDKPPDHGSSPNAIKPEMRIIKLDDYIINIKQFIIRICLKNLSKNYKNTMSKNVRRFQNQRAEKIRGLKSSNPEEFLRILNSDSKQKPKISKYFKNVNGVEINATVPNIDIDDNSTNEEIN